MMTESANNFTNPETIKIFGSKEDENGSIKEADIFFSDYLGNYWGITIQTGIEFVRDALAENGPYDLSIDDLEKSSTDVQKMLWNDELNTTKISEILTKMPYDLLKPFISKIIDSL